MTETTLSPRIENVKVLRKEERVRISDRVTTSTDARRLGLPDNCIVMPMRVLDHPEPIARKRK
jgi:hypothetical protein